MRHASKLAVGIVAVLAAWILVSSVDGQQLGSQPPPVKKGHLIVAGAKEYDLLSQIAEVEGKFRSFDPDKSIVKVRVEWEHADKEHQDEFDRNQKTYKDQMKNLTDRYGNLQKEHRQAMARARTGSDKQNQQNNYNTQMQSLTNDKRNADQQYRDALQKLGMVRDYIDYELLVAKDAPIRKMWAPKMFDDKGKPRDMTREERLKHKGTDPKLVGWITKLEAFEINTPVKLKIRPAGDMKQPEPDPEPVNSQTTASAEFKTFESAAGRFSILMPGVPKESTLAVQTAVGQVQVTSFTAELAGIAYGATFSDMPKGLITDANREALFDGAVKGHAEAVKGTIHSTNKTRLGNHDGRESLVKLPSGVFVRMKSCYSGDRIYTLQVLGPEATVKSNDASTFFDSFKELGAQGALAKDDPAISRQAVRLEDRPVVKMVIAEYDPNAPPPAPAKQPALRKY